MSLRAQRDPRFARDVWKPPCVHNGLPFRLSSHTSRVEICVPVLYRRHMAPQEAFDLKELVVPIVFHPCDAAVPDSTCKMTPTQARINDHALSTTRAIRLRAESEWKIQKPGLKKQKTQLGIFEQALSRLCRVTDAHACALSILCQ